MRARKGTKEMIFQIKNLELNICLLFEILQPAALLLNLQKQSDKKQFF